VAEPDDVPTIYDGIAAEYAIHARTGVYNALYDRPAVLGLLGDVAGKRVLDAGCGPGLYLEELVARGADAVGVDASAEMVKEAKRRLGDRATVARHDLRRPLPFPDSDFDAAISALVIHYLDDRVAFLRELKRVVKPGGIVVFSTQHPLDDWRRHGGSYFAIEKVADTWRTVTGGREVSMPFWRMPLTVIFDEVREAGFEIDRLLEPKPSLEVRELEPETYKKLSTQPTFIALRLKRPLS
jgi:SAM-dependent methyltransferase